MQHVTSCSWWHLVFNLVVQLVLGLPLEMVHGTARTAIIYGAGVLAGKLIHSQHGVTTPYLCQGLCPPPCWTRARVWWVLVAGCTGDITHDMTS